MRTCLIALAGAIGIGFACSPAHAVGCISGGIAGAAAGHLAHHGVLGALGGCIAGHELHKHQMRQEQLQNQQNNAERPNNGNAQPMEQR